MIRPMHVHWAMALKLAVSTVTCIPAIELGERGRGVQDRKCSVTTRLYLRSILPRSSAGTIGVDGFRLTWKTKLIAPSAAARRNKQASQRKPTRPCAGYSILIGGDASPI